MSSGGRIETDFSDRAAAPGAGYGRVSTLARASGKLDLRSAVDTPASPGSTPLAPCFRTSLDAAEI